MKHIGRVEWHSVHIIADDTGIFILGCGDTMEEASADHDRNLLPLLERCRERNLRLNKGKLQLRCYSTVFMGTYTD